MNSVCRFQISFHPDEDAFAVLEAASPQNPFARFAYARAMERLGYQPWLITLENDEGFLNGCLALCKTGRLNKILEIPSCPRIEEEEFWRGLNAVCAKRNVTRVIVNSFASKEKAPVPWGSWGLKRSRTEYVLPLSGNGEPALVEAHRRNVKKAEKAGIQVVRDPGKDAIVRHLLLVNASMYRRVSRGEDIAAEQQERSFDAFIDCGAGEFFTAMQNGSTLSSIFVLLAAEGAYYYSAGTSPEGMKLGASQFLVLQVSKMLRDRGMKCFNLGGADPSNEGLVRFKAGFGTAAVPLSAYEVRFTKPLRLIMNAAASVFRTRVNDERWTRQ